MHVGALPVDAQLPIAISAVRASIASSAMHPSISLLAPKFASCAALCLLVAMVYAEVGYTYDGDLNGDGIADSLKSGPNDGAGKGGWPFALSISGPTGAIDRRVILIVPGSTWLESGERPKLWYLGSSGMDPFLGCICLYGTFHGSSVPLSYGEEISDSVGGQILGAIQRRCLKLEFERIENYQPPESPDGTGW